MPYKDPEKKRERDRLRYAKNREQRREQARHLYWGDPQHRERAIERAKQWRDKNRDRDLANCRRWREEHVEERREYSRQLRSDPEYRKKQAIYMMFYRQRRKAEKYGRDGLINQGLPRRDNGQEDHSRRDRAA